MQEIKEKTADEIEILQKEFIRHKWLEKELEENSMPFVKISNIYEQAINKKVKELGVDIVEEERFEQYNKLPNSIKDIMNWLCDTRFYKKTYLERKKYFDDVKEKWKFCDFVVQQGTLENPIVIKIGEIPRYQGDHEKSICIDFKNIDNCYLIRGYATGLYASKVINNIYEIPKYMIKDLQEFLEEGRKKDV